MKNLKIIPIILMVSLIALLSLILLSSCGNNDKPDFRYELKSDGSYEIVGIGTIKDNDIIIPSEHNGVTVTSIAASAFAENTNITSVVIPNSITRIEQHAFYYCKSLISVTIGANVKNCADDAFFGCDKLIEACIDSDNVLIDKETLGNIGYYALNIYSSNNGKSNISITDNGFIFYKDDIFCYLLGYNGNDKNITLPENYNGEQYKIYKYAFYYNENITSVIIPDSINDMDIMAFAYCTNLESITIGKGLNEISQGAFIECIAIKSITIPSNIEIIGHRAFVNCSNLTNATFENPENWHVGITSTPNEENESIILNDPQIAAEYLKNTYAKLCFFKL